MNLIFEFFQSLGFWGGILAIFMIIYSVLSFLVPFFVFSLCNKVDELNIHIKMLNNEIMQLKNMNNHVPPLNMPINQPFNPNGPIPR